MRCASRGRVPLQLLHNSSDTSTIKLNREATVENYKTAVTYQTALNTSDSLTFTWCSKEGTDDPTGLLSNKAAPGKLLVSSSSLAAWAALKLAFLFNDWNKISIEYLSHHRALSDVIVNKWTNQSGQKITWFCRQENYTDFFPAGVAEVAPMMNVTLQDHFYEAQKQLFVTTNYFHWTRTQNLRVPTPVL